MLFFFVSGLSALFAEIDYNTIYQMAIMSHNTYCGIYDNKWINTTLDQVTNISISDKDVNAYLFTNIEKNIGVVAFKGTSISLLGFNNEIDKDDYLLLENDLKTSDGDKFNDNLFFSCCFYKQSNLFEMCDVCDVVNNQICLGLLNKKVCCKECYYRSLDFSLNYINIVKEIIKNAMGIIDFEKSKIIFTGHSLGGFLASVSSILYNKQAITFETPGGKHYLKLLNMTGSENIKNIYNYGHNADPIFNGNCGSTCSMFGYNINTKCHFGYKCLYDAKGKLGYTESILNHRIGYIIKNVIPKWGYELPECIIDNECVDCDDWEYQ